jgi:hypothetical protein
LKQAGNERLGIIQGIAGNEKAIPSGFFPDQLQAV